MLARTVRSGLTEGFHDGTACVADAAGTILHRWGLSTRPFFYRSAIKPFQAYVALEYGASLGPEQTAIAASSHGGHPVHLAYVRSMLDGVGLDESALRTPIDWPLSPRAKDRLRRVGETLPRRIFHNCSGKHAALLAGCVASGLTIDDYFAESHPVQVRTREVVGDVTGFDPSPTGVDGCGFPTLRGTVESLAVGFARLSTDPDFTAVRSAMMRFPALTGDALRPDGKFAAWWDGPVKVGAMGSIGAGREGIGIAVKSAEGSLDVAMVGMMEVTRRVGLLSHTAQGALDDVARPPVLGGGRPVGAMVPELT